MPFLAEVPFIRETNWIDYVALGVVVFFFLWGAVRGLMLQLAGLGVLIGSLLLASLVSKPIGVWILGKFSGLTMGVARWVGFAIMLLVFLAVGMALAHALRKVLQAKKALGYDRLFGGLLGGLKGFLIVVVVVYAIQSLTYSEDEPPSGISAQIEISRTMEVSRWAKRRVLPFLPPGAKDWVIRHTDAVDPLADPDK